MIALLIASLVPLAAAPTPQEPPSAEELSAWRGAAGYSEQRGGLSLLVRRGGEVVFEQYVEGYGPQKPFRIASGCLGMWAVAALAAEQDGLLDLDEQVSETIEEWRGVAGKDAITVRQLLTLESGLAANDKKVRDETTQDHYQAALETAMVALPGERFRFGPTAWYVFGVLLERKLGEQDADALAFLRRRVLDPIGLEVYYWSRDRAGRPDIPAGAYLTAREWSKFGQLVLDRGRVGERQLVDAERLQACFRPSRLKPAYGLGFWLFEALDGIQEDPAPLSGEAQEQADRDQERAAALPRDVVISAGFGKQRMFVLPSHDLVVVRQGLPGADWSDVDFLRILLGIDPLPAKDEARRDG